MTEGLNEKSTIKLLATGILGTIVVLAIAAAIISPFSVTFFTGWVGLAFLAATPTQIILALLWNGQLPFISQSLGQPWRGLVLTFSSMLAGGLIATIMNFTVGGGMGPTPMLSQYAILSVVVMLWLIPIWQAWPFSTIHRNPYVFGILALIGVYLIAFGLWVTFFNYDALAGAPFYKEELAPKGFFPMWTAMVFSVTTGAVVVVHVLFDFWPIEKLSLGKAQPIRGIVGSLYVIALSFLAHWVFLDMLGMEPVAYMVKVPVSIIFGVFLTTNMMQMSLFASISQPIRGLLLLALASPLAFGMFHFYQWVSQFHADTILPSGPKGMWQQEIWIATAMLSITFPVIIVVSDFFKFWPIKRN